MDLLVYLLMNKDQILSSTVKQSFINYNVNYLMSITKK